MAGRTRTAITGLRARRSAVELRPPAGVSDKRRPASRSEKPVEGRQGQPCALTRTMPPIAFPPSTESFGARRRPPRRQNGDSVGAMDALMEPSHAVLVRPTWPCTGGRPGKYVKVRPPVNTPAQTRARARRRSHRADIRPARGPKTTRYALYGW